MAFIVVYQRADGSSAVESCSDLNAAVEAAERLRNVDAIERPRIFETNEIRYDFQPYYRIKVVDKASETTVGTALQQTPAAHGETAIERDIAAQEAAVGMATSDDVDDVSASAGSVDWTETQTDHVETVDSEMGSVEAPDGSGVAAEAIDSAETDGDGLFGHGDETPEVAADSVAGGVAEEVASAPVAESVDGGVTSGQVAGAAGVAAGATAGAATQKSGLFDKFVSSLEGKKTPTDQVADAVEGAPDLSPGAVMPTDVASDVSDMNPADAIDDLTDDVNPRRGLFGR